MDVREGESRMQQEAADSKYALKVAVSSARADHRRTKRLQLVGEYIVYCMFRCYIFLFYCCHVSCREVHKKALVFFYLYFINTRPLHITIILIITPTSKTTDIDKGPFTCHLRQYQKSRQTMGNGRCGGGRRGWGSMSYSSFTLFERCQNQICRVRTLFHHFIQII